MVKSRKTVNLERMADKAKSDFEKCRKLLQSMQKQAKESPQTAHLILPAFYRLLDGLGMSSDMLPLTADTFAVITQKFSPEQMTSTINTLHEHNKDDLVMRRSDIICKNNPSFALPIFNFMSSQIEKTPYCDNNKNFLILTVGNLANVLLYAADKDLPKMIKRINSFEPQTQDLLVSSYGRLYAHKSSLRETIWHKLLQEAQNTTQFYQLYKNLEAIVDADSSKISECLHLISSKIDNPNHDNIDLKKAYKVLGKIRNLHPHTEKVDAVIMRGLQNPQNSTGSKRVAYRQMGKIEELISRSTIGQRVEKTDKNPHGFNNVDYIKADETAVLFLGGNATNSDERANGYLSSLEKLLKSHQIEENVPLYAAIYDFGDFEDRAITFNDYLARTKLMQDHHRRAKITKTLNEDTLHPRYIDELFDKVLLRRISDENGKKLSVAEACAKIRKLTVVAHCHGAYTFLKLEEKMQKKMQELGYSAEERAKIQHEMLCVAHAPDAPLGISKSTMISFASAQDLEINHHNNFENEIRAMSKNNEVLFSYFPGKQGEMFLAPSLGDEIAQHNFVGYDTTQKGLNKEGKAMLGLSGNTVVNGVRNSLAGKPLPSVKELVCGKDERVLQLFDKLQENGAKMWEEISSNAAARLKAKIEKGQSNG